MKIIKFSSENCAPCRASKPHWEKFKEAYPTIKTEVVDVDAKPDMAAKYRVMSVPSLVVEDDDGTIRTTRSGSFTLSTLESLIL